jgi:hypothetical protein
MHEQTFKGTAIRLTPQFKELLKIMNFTHPIPEDAVYVCFLEDGDSCFLEELEKKDPFSLSFPDQMFLGLSITREVEVTFEFD